MLHADTTVHFVERLRLAAPCVGPVTGRAYRVLTCFGADGSQHRIALHADVADKLLIEGYDAPVEDEDDEEPHDGDTAKPVGESVSGEQVFAGDAPCRTLPDEF
jgi:hypothetical protein